MKKLALALAFCSPVLAAENAPIYGTVDSKCVITMETPGIYGNPSPSLLSTDPVNGGIEPIVRFDVLSAAYYKAVISYPEQFSSSPSLSDVVNWTGVVTVNEVTDTQMSGYDAAKREFNNVTEYDLDFAGSTWFKIESEANYGYDKSFPAGEYNSVVEAECIAL